jgi:hypothetical protein
VRTKGRLRLLILIVTLAVGIVLLLYLKPWDMSDTMSGMPYELNCQWINRVEQGPGWRGLTVGVTTEEETLAQVPQGIDPTTGRPYKKVLFEGVYYGYGNVEKCFLDGKLAALSVDENYVGLPEPPHEYPGTVGEWIERFGYPDRVTWAWNGEWEVPDPQFRALVWAEEGVMVTAHVCIEDGCDSHLYYGADTEGPVEELLTAMTVNFILFSPLAEEDLEDSLIFASLPTNLSADDFNLVPNPSVPYETAILMNPWRIESR